MSTHQKAYRYRLLPTPDQEGVFVQWAGARRWVWNWGRARRIEHYQATLYLVAESVGAVKLRAALARSYQATLYLVAESVARYSAVRKRWFPL
jgi:hypothetical protein